jgi:hypothetical protein
VTWPEVYLQSKWLDWRFALEIGNGLFSIVCLFLTVFLAYHLLKVGVQRRIWRKGLFDLPLSMQLAVGFWVCSFGVFISRVIPWASRFANDGHIQLRALEQAGFVMGTFIGLTGFFCVLRVVTRPMLGQWPWILCLFCCVTYLTWTLVRLS